MARLSFIYAAVLSAAFIGTIISGCPKKPGGGYNAPKPPVQFAEATTLPYATVTGTLRGIGVLTLNGDEHSFEPIGKGRLSDSSVDYYGKPAGDERVVTIGGDFSGEAGLLEFPTRDNGGIVRILLRGGDEPVPFALSVVIAKNQASENEKQRLTHLINYYKGQALIERASASLADGDADAAEKFARQALDAAADARRVNGVLAKALVKKGKRIEALDLLASAAEEAKLDAAGFDLWLKLLDEQAKVADGMAALEKLLKAKKMDGATELSVRGSVYLRRLAVDSRFADIKANLKRYIELVDEEEVDRSELPIQRANAAALLARTDEVLAGKPAQLLEERFDKMPGTDWGIVDGSWKLTQAKGESFITATPNGEKTSEIHPKGAIGFTKDLRVSMRVRLRDSASKIDVYPVLGKDEGLRLVVTNTWVRLYRATPPMQSDLDAKLLAEKKVEDPLSDRWISITVTIKGGAVSFAVNGTIAADAKVQKPPSASRPAIVVTGGVVDIDDFVVTSV